MKYILRDIHDEAVVLNVNIETTRWLGLKSSLIGKNLTDLSQLRERTIYSGERRLSPVNITEVSQELEGIRISLAMSGSF